jgi:hypothetical protein
MTTQRINENAPATKNQIRNLAVAMCEEYRNRDFNVDLDVLTDDIVERYMSNEPMTEERYEGIKLTIYVELLERHLINPPWDL